jgi:hypothetical protein
MGDARVRSQRERRAGQHQQHDCGMHRHVRKSEQRLTAEHVAREAQPAQDHPHHRQALVNQCTLRLLCEQQ